MSGRRKLKPPHRTLVRNDLGIPILCAWDDCQQNGYDEIKIVVREPNKRLHYIFCSQSHKSLHANAHRSYGNLHPQIGR